MKTSSNIIGAQTFSLRRDSLALGANCYHTAKTINNVDLLETGALRDCDSEATPTKI